MLISISKYNSHVKKSCVEIAFVEVICKTLLKPSSGVLSDLSKMVPLVTIASHTRMLC